MPTVDDLVQRISLLANKTGAANERAIRDAVKDTIDDINASVQGFTVASRDKTIAVTTANYKAVGLPVRCRRVIELGRYDSSLDRINPAYSEVSEQRYHEMFSGSTTISSRDPQSANLWCFIDDLNTGARQIRIIYPPSSNFTMEVRFFERLYDGNVDRLEQQSLLFDGAVARLGMWFPNEQLLRQQQFERGIESLKSNRRSLDCTIAPKVNRELAIHNIVAGNLVR